jgi:NAD(P)H-flavin reductase
VGLRTDDAMYLLMCGPNGMVGAAGQYFDDRHRSAETGAWQRWLDGLAA